MCGSRPFETIDAGLRKSQIAYLASLDEFRHRSDGLLNRDSGVDAVLVIEVDVIDAQARQGLIAASFNIIRATTDVHAAIIALHTELGCQNHLITSIRDGASNQAFVVSIAIDIGR